MVHALEEIHRLLKPGGVLIDIHPVSGPSMVEIHQNGKIDMVGNFSVSQWITDFQQADDALVIIVQRGMFSVERHRSFDTLTYYDSVGEMRGGFIESIHKYARDAESKEVALPHVETLVARAEELMRAASDDVKLVLREHDHISRLRKSEYRST